MTPKLLESCGRLLFGHNWRAPFEDCFDISNRSLRRMLAGQAEIPEGLAIDIEMAVRDHMTKGDEILAALSLDETEDAS